MASAAGSAVGTASGVRGTGREHCAHYREKAAGQLIRLASWGPAGLTKKVLVTVVQKVFTQGVSTR